MIVIDQAYLDALGLGALPDDVSRELRDHILDTLETRTGHVLAELMGSEAVDEFATISDEDGQRAFLAAHVPDFVEIGEEQFAELTDEIRSVVPQLLELEGLAPTAADEHSSG